MKHAQLPVISANDVALLLGVNRRSITDWRNESPALPVAVRGGPGQADSYDPTAVVAWYADRQARQRCGSGEAALDAQQERARLDKAKREHQEMINRKASGELLPADEVAQAWTERVTVARSRFLALPVRLAPELMMAKDLRAIEDTLRDGIYEVLAELSGEADPSHT